MIFVSSMCYNFLALHYTFLVMIKFLESFDSKLPTFFPKRDICTTDKNLMFLFMKHSPDLKKKLKLFPFYSELRNGVFRGKVKSFFFLASF